MNNVKFENCFGYLKKGFSDNNCSWFVDYDFSDDTTALVLCGSDGIGVLFIILRGDKSEELNEIAKKYEQFNAGIFGAFGECLRYATACDALIPERCTIGGLGGKLTMRPIKK